MNPRLPNDTTAPTREPIARFFFGRCHTARPKVVSLPLPAYQRDRCPDEGERVVVPTGKRS